MKKEWRHPFWENYQKDRITAKLVILHEDGKETSSTATVSKYTATGTVNPDFEEILRQKCLYDQLPEFGKEEWFNYMNRF